MSGKPLNFLRPFLHANIKARNCPAYTRLFAASTCQCSSNSSASADTPLKYTGDYKKRIAQLENRAPLNTYYPRVQPRQESVKFAFRGLGSLAADTDEGVYLNDKIVRFCGTEASYL
jgi:hypothetical protein